MNPPPLPSAVRPSWWDRNWIWCSALMVGVIAAGTIGIIWGVFSFVHSSEAYQKALARVRTAPAVISALGTPIEDSPMFSGSVASTGQTGNAQMLFYVHGPRAAATVIVKATRTAGVWHYEQLIVSIDGTKQIIDLSERRPALPAEPPR